MLEILLKKYPSVFALIFLLFFFFLFYHPLSAQDKNKDKKENPTSSYSGTEAVRKKGDQGTKDVVNKERRIKTKRELKEDASMRASYRGQEKYMDLPALRAQKNQKLASYSGKVSLRKYDRFKNRIDNKDRDMASYSGSVRYVNIPKQREKISQKMASSKGPVLIRVRRKPKGDITSEYRGAPRRPRQEIKYSKTNLRKGARVKKSELPNYAKEKKRKLKYDKGETMMWQRGGSTMPGSGKRELPKKQKGKKNKQENNSEQGEEIPDN